ncbi:hypothetical protein QBC38DRAFT_151112 [Podospora fimiseda]|uniref:Rhodopsin domain-containing protein n=1 Tax=Podospora fimiseda TaxID=252190 RepID=A0AAN7BS64_9PEZI|nr:hypothetical protein QBC38DRAFT_151112 [Podospora fimiseda]
MTARVNFPITDGARDALIGISFLWAINGFVVFFRLLGRFRGVGIDVDDVLALVAFLISGATIGFNASVFVSGVGYDYDPTAPYFADLNNNLSFMLKITFIFTLFYIWALIALKISQLWFYYRAFSVQLKVWIYIVGAIIAVWGIVMSLVFTFLCTPVNLQWTLNRPGKCMDQIAVLKSIIMSNVLTDLMIVILPMKTVWSLQMRTTEKVAVAGCFAIGLACVIIGIVRFWQIYVIDLLGNFTGTSLTTFMLCSVELMLAGICINIPMLRPFYIRWRQKHKSSGDDSSYPHAGSQRPTGNLPTVGSAPVNYTAAWIELDDDKEHGEVDSNGDGSSQVNLTGTPAVAPNHSIHVSTKWKVERT